MFGLKIHRLSIWKICFIWLLSALSVIGVEVSRHISQLDNGQISVSLKIHCEMEEMEIIHAAIVSEYIPDGCSWPEFVSFNGNAIIANESEGYMKIVLGLDVPLTDGVLEYAIDWSGNRGDNIMFDGNVLTRFGRSPIIGENGFIVNPPDVMLNVQIEAGWNLCGCNMILDSNSRQQLIERFSRGLYFVDMQSRLYCQLADLKDDTFETSPLIFWGYSEEADKLILRGWSEEGKSTLKTMNGWRATTVNRKQVIDGRLEVVGFKKGMYVSIDDWMMPGAGYYVR